jgi:hypothetical protein
MKPALLIVALALLLLPGCGRSARDELSLRPYTNIPTGTVVVVGMKIKTNLGFDIIGTNEYVLEGFEDGFVTLRDTNGLSLGYAGSMIKFIEKKKSASNP